MKDRVMLNGQWMGGWVGEEKEGRIGKWMDRIPSNTLGTPSCTSEGSDLLISNKEQHKPDKNNPSQQEQGHDAFF